MDETARDAVARIQDEMNKRLDALKGAPPSPGKDVFITLELDKKEAEWLLSTINFAEDEIPACGGTWDDTLIEIQGALHEAFKD